MAPAACNAGLMHFRDKRDRAEQLARRQGLTLVGRQEPFALYSPTSGAFVAERLSLNMALSLLELEEDEEADAA